MHLLLVYVLCSFPPKTISLSLHELYVLATWGHCSKHSINILRLHKVIILNVFANNCLIKHPTDREQHWHYEFTAAQTQSKHSSVRLCSLCGKWSKIVHCNRTHIINFVLIMRLDQAHCTFANSF